MLYVSFWAYAMVATKNGINSKKQIRFMPNICANKNKVDLVSKSGKKGHF